MHQLPQEHVHTPCSRPSSSKISDDGGAASLPGAQAVGCGCFPPDSSCASRARLVFIPNSSSRARPCSNTIAHKAASEPTFSRVFVRPMRSAQAAVQSTKKRFSCREYWPPNRVERQDGVASSARESSHTSSAVRDQRTQVGRTARTDT